MVTVKTSLLKKPYNIITSRTALPVLEQWSSFCKKAVDLIKKQLELILDNKREPAHVRIMHDNYSVLKRVEREKPSIQQYEDIRFIDETEVASEPWYHPIAPKYAQEEKTSDEDYHNDHWIIGQSGYLRDQLRIGSAYKVHPLFRMYLINEKYHPEEDSYAFSIPEKMIHYIHTIKDIPQKQDRLLGALLRDIIEILSLYTVSHRHHNLKRIE